MSIVFFRFLKFSGDSMAIKFYKLLDLMQRQELSKEELREKIGISSATMAKISKHEYISLEVINKLCTALNCQPGDIMEYIPDDK